MRNIADVTAFNDAAGLNPRKPYFSATYRNDILRFSTPVAGAPASNTAIAYSYKALNTTSALVAGWDSNMKLRAGTTAYSSPTISGEPQIIADGREGSIRGCWYNNRYYYFDFLSSGVESYAQLRSVDANGASVQNHTADNLPTVYKHPEALRTFVITRRPSAFIIMDSGDKLAVYTSYEIITEINQLVCTMHFYYASSTSTSYRRLRTTIQYDIPNYDPTRIYSNVATLDPTSGLVFAASSEAGKFFVIANDGTKALRFTYNNGVEGLLEPVIPIDIDANRLEITDSTGAKSYGKYHQFMPTALTKIGSRYYLNGQMTRTYSNGDKRVMEIYLWSTDGVNWAVGDVSSFIDAAYYKRGEAVRLWNYALIYPSGGSTIYALGNECSSSSVAREMDTGAAQTDFSDVVIEGEVNCTTNSADSAQLMVMKGFDTMDPYDLGGKTLTVNLGYYDAAGAVKSVKMGEYFVESEEHALSSVGRGPNNVVAMDLGAWKLTRWSSITDVDRWSSAFIHDDLKIFSKLIVKGIKSDYAAVDNATGTGLYLSNLNDPFVGYTSTRDDRDGMFTVCARFTDTGSTTKLSAIGLLIGAEDYTDIYTKGNVDRKGFNALMFPAYSTWTGHTKTGPEMRRSNLKRRYDNPATPQNESDTDTAFQWVRRYTNLWERDVYIADSTATDSQYNTITAPAATGESNVVYQGTWTAQHGVDYELVMRRHSGRIQAFARKKGFGTTTISDATYTDYALVYEYQFDKDDRIDWGPRPFWGFVAGTDVFASLDGWNSREYGNIESTLTDAYENVSIETGVSDFPEANVITIGRVDFTAGTGHPTYTWNDTTKQWEQTGYVDGTSNQYRAYIKVKNVNGSWVPDCTFNSRELTVGKVVRCRTWGTDWNCTPWTPSDGGWSNFYARIASFGDVVDGGWREVILADTKGGGLPSQDAKIAFYDVSASDLYAKTFSGSLIANPLLSVDGTTIPLDILTGAVKQSSTSGGRAVFANRQNDAMFLRMVRSDGSYHEILSGSPSTKLGFDYTNPISNAGYINSSGVVSTRDWRLIMHQGMLFPASSTTYGLPGGPAYMIKGDEIVRYMNQSWRSRGSTYSNKTWCIIPAYYTSIFPSVKGATQIQQWSKWDGSKWIEPGDKFDSIPNLAGLRLYISGKGDFISLDGENKQYAVSATASNGASTASVLTFTPALSSGVDSMYPDVERAKDVDKQLKEIAILSGREQFNTSSGLQSYTDPLCFYPVGAGASAKPDSFIKVNYWTMNAGLYNSVKDNLEYVCNLAGISDVKFMDSPVGNPAIVTEASTRNSSLAHFLMEISGTFTTSSSIKVAMRSAYTLTIDFDQYSVTQYSNRGHLTLTLKTAVGFAPAANISGGNATERTIAKVIVPVSDVPWAGSHDLRVILRKERLMVEMDRSPVWTFDLKTYKFGGAKNDSFDLYTDAAGPVVVTPTNVTGGIAVQMIELADEVENQIIDMAQSGGDAVQFITRERHIHTRSTQDGGLQFSRFLEGNRTVVDMSKTGGVSLTQDFIKDQMEYNPYGVPGHVLVTGAEYGEHLDPEWIRQNGYMFASNQNRLLDTVEDSIREAKLLVRMAKEDSDNSEMQMIGLPHIQPEDELVKDYDFPENTMESQVVSGHSIKFNASTLMSQLKIRKKYALE